MVNPACDISFEDEDGDLIDLFRGEHAVRYGCADIIEIDDVDYGIFYMWIWKTIRTNTWARP